MDGRRVLKCARLHLARWGYGNFWAQLARTIARPPTSPDSELVTLIRDGRLVMTLEAAQKDGFLDYLHVEGIVYAPDGTSIPVKLRQTAPGRYEASVSAPVPGNYVVALSPRRGTRRLAPVIGGASQSSSVEFRQFRSNAPLLERIAELTGGRTLDLLQPQAVKLFDRAGMAPSRAALPAWTPLLWLALALFLLDVAARRLAWDALLVRRSVRRATARVEARDVRGREAAATLATLRQVSDQVEHRHTVRPEEPAQEPPTTIPVARAAPEQPPTEAEPVAEPTRIAAALDAFLGKPSAAPPEHPESPEPSEPTPEQTPPTDTTGSLLAAKRRARKKLDGP